MTKRYQGELESLLEAFWRQGLVLFGERVTEEYALQTPIFIDLRHKLYDDLSVLSSLGKALHRKLESVVREDPASAECGQQLIGIPDTATPLALSTALVSQATSFPCGYGQMRKEPAAYPGGQSGQSSYMGTKCNGRQITLIDDVMASGRTKLWAIDELEKEGLKVARVLVVVDREQGGDEKIEERGCPCHSLFTVSDVINHYRETGKIDAATARSALDLLKSKQFR